MVRRGRVLQRAAMKAKNAQLTWSAYIASGVLGAGVTTALALEATPTVWVQHVAVPVAPSVGHVFVSALIGFVVLPFLIFGGLALWYLAAYRRSDHVDDTWDVTADAVLNGAAVVLIFMIRPSTTAKLPPSMELRIIRGGRTVETLKSTGVPRLDHSPVGDLVIARPVQAALPDDYELRWYECSGRLTPEMTRSWFRFENGQIRKLPRRGRLR